MSHFAGLFSLRPGVGPPRALADRFSELLRSWGGHVSEFEHGNFVLIHADYVDARGPGMAHRPGLAAASLAGDLILENTPDDQPRRKAELEALLRAPRLEGAGGLLARAHGTFAVCRYDEPSGQLEVATDALGARPVYWLELNNALVFSTSFRLLVKASGRDFGIDWAAVFEQAAFCYPLAARTLLLGIQVLRDGETIAARPGGFERRRYVRLEDTPLVESSPAGHADYLHSVFMRAVSARCPPDDPVPALLSGGLDSRCIAGALLDLGCLPEAWNCGLDHWQDRVLAVEFAERARIKLNRVSWSPEVLGETPGRVTAQTLAAVIGHVPAPEIFSGDGGGETIGFLMMAPKVLDLLASNRIEEAIEAYVKPRPVSPWLLGSDLYRRFHEAHKQGMAAEFRAMAHLPPQKAMQFFLLRNDLRRHLHDFYEFAQRHPAELLLPFYDRRLLEGVIRIAPPLDPFLGHRFYHEWMKLFRAPVLSVPWQSYPGHEPCPLPMPAGAESQWTTMKPALRQRYRHWRGKALRRLWTRRLPHPAFSRARMSLAALASLSNIEGQAHVFRDFLWIGDTCVLASGPSDPEAR